LSTEQRENLNFYPILDEAADALDRAGKLLTAHLERRNTCEQQ
jgi:hypothetical protein